MFLITVTDTKYGLFASQLSISHSLILELVLENTSCYHRETREMSTVLASLPRALSTWCLKVETGPLGTILFHVK
jgi:hypothetical protein